jgi:hypothetical protein
MSTTSIANLRRFFLGDAFLLFLFTFLAYACFIDTNDLKAYPLQQMAVEAIVERHTLYVDGSRSPYLQPGEPGVGDVFLFKGHLYPAKQPGQFLIGALSYFPLYLLGITYLSHYFLASAWVTLCTGALATAGLVVLVFEFSRHFTKTVRDSIFIAIAFGFGTLAFPYAGVAHHDALATFFIFAAFFLSFEVKRSKDPKVAHAILGGACLALGLTCSMLPILATVPIIAYLLSCKQPKAIFSFILAGFISLIPFFAYNTIAFGNPLLCAYVMGGYEEEFLRDIYPQVFHLQSVIARFSFYFVRPETGIFHFSPVLLLTPLGIASLPSRYRTEKIIIFAIFVLHTGYMLVAKTYGDCQFGPRYLLPLFPFACLGLAPFLAANPDRDAEKQLLLSNLRYVCWILAAVSIFISFLGAAHGTMYCHIDRYPGAIYLKHSLNGLYPGYPLAKIGLPSLVIVSAALLARRNIPSELRPLGRKRPE